MLYVEFRCLETIDKGNKNGGISKLFHFCYENVCNKTKILRRGFCQIPKKISLLIDHIMGPQ